MIVLISLSLIIPFLMILFAQKRNYETELYENAAIFGGEIATLNYEYKKLSQKFGEITNENYELDAKLRAQESRLEAQELKAMRSCRNWSKMPQLKCAVNPSGSCLECRDYEVLGK